MTTEKMRVSASSIISRVADTRATPANMRPSVPFKKSRGAALARVSEQDVSESDSNPPSRVRRRRNRLGVSTAARLARGLALRRLVRNLPAYVGCVRDWQRDLPSAARAIVLPVVASDAGLRAVHRHLHRRRPRRYFVAGRAKVSWPPQP